MGLPPDNFGEGIEFGGCLSTAFVCLFVQTDLVTMISHEWLEQSQ